MGTLIQIAQLILCLSILVVLHELGHFLPAKYFKTKIEKFYLFFDYKFALFKKKIGETEYGIGWIPMGGYVKIAGMIDESMDLEQLKQEPQPWEYRSKTPLQRLIIICGGVIVNFFLAWFIYAMLFVANGDNYIDNSKFTNGIAVDSVGNLLGFKSGDKILKVDGKPQPKFDQLPLEILFGDNVTVERDGKEMTFNLSDEGKRDAIKSKGQAFLMPRAEIIIDSLIPKMPALAAGMQKGDKIVGLNGQKVQFFDQFAAALNKVKKDSLAINIVRNGQELILKTKADKDGKLGFQNDKSFMEKAEVKREVTLLHSIPLALNYTINSLQNQIRQFKLIFNKTTQGYKEVSGPLRMFKIFKPTWDWTYFWNFTAMFSVWLAFLNILPIPGLDGGHAMFILIEVITRKKPTEKTLEIAQTIGVVILLSLMALVFGNDIWHLVTGK
jgi:regulator of sigma E protease